jgi:hypothetical protein
VENKSLPKENAMKKTQLAWSMMWSMMLPVMALAATLYFASQPALAQSASGSSSTTSFQEQPMQPDNQSAAAEKTFSGKIVKSGTKLVLAGDGKTTYQLDDQQKAHDFLNKSVKVTGVLDASTGTIRVSAIEPA